MSVDFDTSSPADDGVISQFPTNERAFRSVVSTVVNTTLAVDHDTATGHHKQVTLDDPGSDPTFASAKLGIFQRSGAIFATLASGTKKGVPLLTRGASGDMVCFMQAAAPTFWTQNTAVNDKVMRMASGAGAGTGGSWTISGVTVDGHAISIAEMPSHNHTATSDRNGLTGGTQTQTGGAGAVNPAAQTITVGFTGGSSTHTHGLTADGTWRPAYVDIIACYMT